MYIFVQYVIYNENMLKEIYTKKENK